ncbi:MAG: SDR family oxidoreductase [Gemmataceae bacterium]|nr:SDR family oxidoreductase [Gemmataceae bacterium]
MSIFDRFKLTGKRLFITGGSRGLGREMALAIADAGADVVLVGRDVPSLEKTAGDIRALGRQAWFLQADVGKTDECERACQEALEKHGPIDILINNVGGRRENIPTESMPLEKWRELMDLNLTSCVLCTKLIGAAMIERGQGGRIINIASINSLVAGRGIAGRHYETAKGAMLQFTRSVAADWAVHKITVNAILPGGFMTEPNQRWSKIHPEVIERFKANIPLGKFGEPEDLGPLAVYLASDASRYMTGAALVIDGGYTLW